MRPIINLELALSALVLAAVILVFASMRFVVDEPGKEPLVYFIAFVVVTGVAVSASLFQRRRGDTRSAWSRPVAPATANVIIYTVSALWFGFVTFIVYFLFSEKTSPHPIVALSLALVAVVTGGEYLRRSVLKRRLLLAYAAASIGGLVVFLVAALSL